MSISEPASESPQPDPGSFRDRTARIFYRNGEVFRALRPQALDAWQRLAGTAFYGRARAAGQIVLSELVDTTPPGDWAAVLRHETLPFVSYPYEWCFGMLKAAALLHLDLFLAALKEGLTIKDATPYNVQWIGARPTFIDVTSFEPLRSGEPWVAYRQFCQLFLYPLLLEAYRRVPFQSWLRGNLEGIEAEGLESLLGWRDAFRPGVVRHVFMHAAMQRRETSGGRSVRAEMRDAGFPVALIEANARGLRRLIARLQPARRTSAWTGYAQTHSYTDADHQAKIAFVTEVAASRPWGLVWDLGCNTGWSSRTFAKHARYVVALDSDPVVVERLYETLLASGPNNVLPLVVNVLDPSPGLGWNGAERRPLLDRGKPDLVLCLALMHHLVIGGNVPLPDLVAWLARLSDAVVLEFVASSDPMVQTLVKERSQVYDDYTQDVLERCLQERYGTFRRVPLSSGHRTLYFAWRDDGRPDKITGS